MMTKERSYSQRCELISSLWITLRLKVTEPCHSTDTIRWKIIIEVHEVTIKKHKGQQKTRMIQFLSCQRSVVTSCNHSTPNSLRQSDMDNSCAERFSCCSSDDTLTSERLYRISLRYHL